MRNIYATLTDMIHKNIDKVRLLPHSRYSIVLLTMSLDPEAQGQQQHEFVLEVMYAPYTLNVLKTLNPSEAVLITVPGI